MFGEHETAVPSHPEVARVLVTDTILPFILTFGGSNKVSRPPKVIGRRMVLEALNESLCFEPHIINLARANVPLSSNSAFVSPLTKRIRSSAKACRKHPSESSSSRAVSRTMFQKKSPLQDPCGTSLSAENDKF
ncbi:hypothetical protein AVEN_84230-1 [Araneus ventricosus]|uniref:Uncharacterized protein n=1 Tax=Araneus ventricosus TaxID=182803 RepID=A0A4Y2L3M8_ARAVE|nr:hypothetical protein AVEN_84230-1 [Araneus ventricosus]